jgi:hypothetical protein
MGAIRPRSQNPNSGFWEDQTFILMDLTEYVDRTLPEVNLSPENALAPSFLNRDLLLRSI